MVSRQRELGLTTEKECVVDDVCIARGAELILELHRETALWPFTRLFQKWVSTGTNLALAGPLTSPWESQWTTRSRNAMEQVQPPGISPKVSFVILASPSLQARKRASMNTAPIFLEKKLDGKPLVYFLPPSAEPP